jgi:hypothetical protein
VTKQFRADIVEFLEGKKTDHTTHENIHRAGFANKKKTTTFL